MYSDIFSLCDLIFKFRTTPLSLYFCIVSFRIDSDYDADMSSTAFIEPLPVLASTPAGRENVNTNREVRTDRDIGARSFLSCSHVILIKAIFTYLFHVANMIQVHGLRLQLLLIKQTRNSHSRQASGQVICSVKSAS